MLTPYSAQSGSTFLAFARAVFPNLTQQSMKTRCIVKHKQTPAHSNHLALQVSALFDVCNLKLASIAYISIPGNFVAWFECAGVFVGVIFIRFLFVFVPRAGVEPARPNGHMALNHACLPISAPGRERDSLWIQIFQNKNVTWLGLEPRTLSLKVRCSNQLSYQVNIPRKGVQR